MEISKSKAKEEFRSARRSRVDGSGPRRTELPSFKLIDTIDDFEELKSEVMDIYGREIHNNDLYTSKYEISKHCELRDLLPNEHKNLLLQEPKIGVVPDDERQFTEWNERSRNTKIRKYIEDEFKNTYRARIAILAPNSAIDWHIDVNTTVSCRVHIPIYNPGFIFEIKNRSIIETLSPKAGSVYFTNTAWPHRVYNSSNESRISVIVDMPFESIAPFLSDTSN